MAGTTLCKYFADIGEKVSIFEKSLEYECVVRLTNELIAKCPEFGTALLCATSPAPPPLSPNLYYTINLNIQGGGYTTVTGLHINALGCHYLDISAVQRDGFYNETFALFIYQVLRHHSVIPTIEYITDKDLSIIMMVRFRQLLANLIGLITYRDEQIIPLFACLHNGCAQVKTFATDSRPSDRCAQHI